MGGAWIWEDCLVFTTWCVLTCSSAYCIVLCPTVCALDEYNNTRDIKWTSNLGEIWNAHYVLHECVVGMSVSSPLLPLWVRVSVLLGLVVVVYTFKYYKYTRRLLPWALTVLGNLFWIGIGSSVLCTLKHTLIVGYVVLNLHLVSWPPDCQTEWCACVCLHVIRFCFIIAICYSGHY